MTTTYIVTNAFAVSILEIKNPWFIVNEDYVVGVYEGRAAARTAKATGLAGKIVSLKEITFEIAAPIEDTPIEDTSIEPKTKTKTEPKTIENHSTVEKPCRLVWDLADAMVGARRKDVIAAAESKGVAYYTARTQYQLWAQVQKEMADRAAATK
jgi:hypothetical protein